MASPAILFAAGSLQVPLSDIVLDFQEATGAAVAATFGPSGLLRSRIEEGETAHLFASADMDHPRALAASGRGGTVVPFASNALCAIVRDEMTVSTETLLDALLDPDVRVATSTPRADPSGDYAWAVFARAEAVRSGALESLAAKALKLTGGPATADPPAGRNIYAWIVGRGQADIFLTYRTNALLARREDPSLRIITLPPALAVGAAYGMIVLRDAPASADALTDYILSARGRMVLQDYGFGVP